MVCSEARGRTCCKMPFRLIDYLPIDLTQEERIGEELRRRLIHECRYLARQRRADEHVARLQHDRLPAYPFDLHRRRRLRSY